ncbi:MAG: 2-hydroxyacid dehydrogenase [Minisyncoccia bacterium]
MKLYIFTPNKEALFTKEIETTLQDNFDLIFYTSPKPLAEHTDFINDTNEKIVALDPDYFGWKFSAEEIDLMKNVKAICLQTTSFSWIDTKHANSKNIPVLNLKGFSTEAVAEFAFMLALGVARKLPLIIQADYKQDFVAHQGVELKGKTAGVIGLGRIGTSVANKCKGFGMSVQYWSKNSKDDKYQFLDLEKLIATSDVIFITLAQNEDTAHILTDDILRKMKETTIFVSIAHKVFNEELILKMVKDGKLYGYGTEEDNGNPTKIKGNILVLPSVAWATKESMDKNADMWVNSIISAGNGFLLSEVR